MHYTETVICLEKDLIEGTIPRPEERTTENIMVGECPSNDRAETGECNTSSG